jgi:hypothetical protein
VPPSLIATPSSRSPRKRHKKRKSMNGMNRNVK